MTATAQLAVDDGFRSDSERKKRLGQYFTGVRLARLLAALARTDAASSVIDPMVGTGDMLVGCLEHGAQPELLGGIEIDPIAQTACLHRLKELGPARLEIVLGNAFSPETIRRLPTTAWDVCITNPPYVRYQSVSQATGGEMPLPSAIEVRRGLIESISDLKVLDGEDKRLFCKLAEGYSGLADLAVPSWMLCAGLVKVGGTLAVLVPTTWLNRDYAHPVQYLLARWFDVRYVVEDADVAWFPDVLVRTSLVVATRIERRESAFAPPRNSGHLHLKLGRELADERSVVGALYPAENDPDLAFAHDAECWHAARRLPKTARVGGHWVPATHVVSSLRHAAEQDEWLGSVETRVKGSTPNSRTGPAVPLPLAAALGSLAGQAFVTLDDIGWRVGQGLRTGANEFFYVAAAGNGQGQQVAVSSVLGGGVVEAPSNVLLPVLRRQADLPEGLVIVADDLSDYALVLTAYALPEDLTTDVQRFHHPLPAALAEHVRCAASTNIGSEDEPRFIPGLSAVVTNVRSASPGKPDAVPRFWYQLPPFTDRHRANLVLARVNHGHPRTYLNEGRRALIDANFSTLWPTDEASVDEHALLALLNSAWAAAALEAACTVLGGGALKVEAAHLRRLPLPKVAAPVWKKLSRLGQRLAAARPGTHSQVLATIDEMLFAELVGPARAPKALAGVKRLAAQKLAERSG